ncbi:MAG: ABC transporter transmembrane domain-containing protein [Tetrasphaera sp.]
MHGKFSIYRRLLGYLRPYPGAVALGYGGMLVATLLNLAVPQLLKFAIDQGLAADDPSALFWAGGAIMLIALVRAGAGYLQRFYGEWLTFRVAYDLRNDFYQAVQHLSFAFHDRAHTGDLMSRATGDIGETERFVGIGLMELRRSGGVGRWRAGGHVPDECATGAAGAAVGAAAALPGGALWPRRQAEVSGRFSSRWAWSPPSCRRA